MLVEDFSRRFMADSQKEGLEGLPVCEKMVTITEYAQSSPSNRKKVDVSRRKSVKICLVEIRHIPD
jgi:hypothetical protein